MRSCGPSRCALTALTRRHLRRRAPLGRLVMRGASRPCRHVRRYAYIFAASEIGLKHEVRNDLEVTLMHSLTPLTVRSTPCTCAPGGGRAFSAAAGPRLAVSVVAEEATAHLCAKERATAVHLSKVLWARPGCARHGRAAGGSQGGRYYTLHANHPLLPRGDHGYACVEIEYPEP